MSILTASRNCPFQFDEVAAGLGMLPGHEAMRVWSESCTINEWDGVGHRYRLELDELAWHQTQFAAWRRRLH